MLVLVLVATLLGTGCGVSMTRAGREKTAIYGIGGTLLAAGAIGGALSDDARRGEPHWVPGYVMLGTLLALGVTTIVIAATADVPNDGVTPRPATPRTPTDFDEPPVHGAYR